MFFIIPDMFEGIDPLNWQEESHAVINLDQVKWIKKTCNRFAEGDFITFYFGEIEGSWIHTDWRFKNMRSRDKAYKKLIKIIKDFQEKNLNYETIY